MRSYRILGVPIKDGTLPEAIADVRRLLAAPGPRSLLFVNAHTLNLAAGDPGFRDTLSRATRVFGDGTGVRWAARLRGVRLRANLNGTDLVPALFEASPGLRCFLLGSAPERIEGVLAGARARFPRIEFVGGHHGYLDEAASEAALAQIRRSGAELVLVGMGNPIQERWIEAHGAKVPEALFAGVGGLFEYWHGGLKRAPGLVRRLGAEWVHLMIRQPRKVPRYMLGNPLYLARIVASLSRDRAAMRTDEDR